MSAVKIWLLLGLLWTCCTEVRAQQPVLNIYNNGEYVLTDYLYFFEDPDSKHDIEAIRTTAFADNFTALKNEFLTFGLTRSSLWFRTRMRYPQGAPNVLSSKIFYYEAARSQLDIAELYVIRKDGSINKITSDMRTPMQHRPIVHINSVFPFTIALGEEVTLYMRVQNKTGTFLPQTLWSPSAFATKVTHEEYLYGIFYGGMIIMLVYNMLLYLSSKDVTYLYYFGFLSCTFIFEFVDIGHGFSLFNDQVFFLHKQYIPFFFWLLWLGGMRYTQHFLEIKERHPALNISVNAYHFLSFFSLMIALQYNYYATVQYIAHFGGIAVILVLVLSIYVWHKGNENAEFFTYAWSFNMTGFALFSSVVIGLAPAHPLLLYSMPIGTLMEAIVLSLALADRLKRAEKHKLDANSRAMENLSRYRSVFDNAGEGLYQMTLSGRLLNVNHAFARFFGYNTPAMVLKNSSTAVEALFTEPVRQQSQLATEGWLSEELNPEQQSAIHSHALHYAKLVRDTQGQPLHIEGKLTDISEHKERERAQRDRLKERREKEVAMRATQSKSHFLKHMSFEIRTPLTAIIGFSEILRESGLSAQEKRQAIGAIIGNSRQLLQLINNILDYSKIEADKMVLEQVPVDLMAILDLLQQQLHDSLAQKGLYFNVKITPPVPGNILSDPTRIRQVLFNLCNNAVAYTEKGGVTVSLSWDAKAKILYIKVQDTGSGISQAKLHALSSAIGTGPETQERRGLGLIITRQLTRLLGGEIDIDSKEKEGTTVTLSLPAPMTKGSHWINQSNGAGAPASPLHNIPQLAGRVLLAEDNVVNQKLIQRVVMKTGAEVVVVADGEQALQAALKSTFDLVLMDINMPVMGGLEATQKLREAGYSRPIYALTAESGKDEMAATLAAGCNGHLNKPLELTAFYHALSTSLPRRDAHNIQSEGAQ